MLRATTSMTESRLSPAFVRFGRVARGQPTAEFNVSDGQPSSTSVGVYVCVCVFLFSIDRANRVFHEKSSVAAGKNQSLAKEAEVRRTEGQKAQMLSTTTTYLLFENTPSSSTPSLARTQEFTDGKSGGQQVWVYGYLG